jgi:hypothetical protein
VTPAYKREIANTIDKPSALEFTAAPNIANISHTCARVISIGQECFVKYLKIKIATVIAAVA